MDGLTVSVIVPVFGPEHLTRACLDALKWTASEYELVLVDNATGYDLQADVVIRNATNLGFSVACNQGADAATGDILVFLNCDTEPRLDWLANLMRAFDASQVAMAGPKLVYPNGSIQCAGIRIWHGNGQAGGENRHDEHSSNADEDGATGACLAIRTTVFDECGGFDAEFWNGYDDVDLCLNVKSRGYKIAYVAESVVMHHESATGGERWSRVHENIQRLNDKWGSS